MLLVIFFDIESAQSQRSHTVSVTFTPALTGVNVTNFNDFSINSYTKQLYSKQRPKMPNYGYVVGLIYQYRFSNHWSFGAGILKSTKKSNSGEFYLSPTSQSRTKYEHRYSSIELPLHLEYTFSEKRIVPIIAIEPSIDIFKKFDMSVYSINNQTNMSSNFLTETHYGVKWSLVKLGAGVMAGITETLGCLGYAQN